MPLLSIYRLLTIFSYLHILFSHILSHYIDSMYIPSMNHLPCLSIYFYFKHQFSLNNYKTQLVFYNINQLIHYRHYDSQNPTIFILFMLMPILLIILDLKHLLANHILDKLNNMEIMEEPLNVLINPLLLHNFVWLFHTVFIFCHVLLFFFLLKQEVITYCLISFLQLYSTSQTIFNMIFGYMLMFI